MKRRKIPRAQIERTLQNPDLNYESYDKLAAEGMTEAGNIVFVYYVEPEPGEALVISVKRRRATTDDLLWRNPQGPQEGS